MAARLASRLWRRVHPDLFARWPSAQSANERSMQDLRALLESAEEHRTALKSGAAPPPAPPPATARKILCRAGGRRASGAPRNIRFMALAEPKARGG